MEKSTGRNQAPDTVSGASIRRNRDLVGVEATGFRIVVALSGAIITAVIVYVILEITRV